MQHHHNMSASESHSFHAGVLEQQHSALGEAGTSPHLERDFTHNPEDGGIEKVITCVSIEIPA